MRKRLNNQNNLKTKKWRAQEEQPRKAKRKNNPDKELKNMNWRILDPKTELKTRRYSAMRLEEELKGKYQTTNDEEQKKKQKEEHELIGKYQRTQDAE